MSEELHQTRAPLRNHLVPNGRGRVGGKNQFNSTFPVSLACFMRDKGLNAVYLKLNKDLKVEVDEISFNDVFNSTAKNSELRFDFESNFDPYQIHTSDDVGKIDLVVKHGDDFRRALEIKLTVVPDSSTFDKTENEWGAELVIRPASAIYSCAWNCRFVQGRFSQDSQYS